MKLRLPSKPMQPPPPYRRLDMPRMKIVPELSLPQMLTHYVEEQAHKEAQVLSPAPKHAPSLCPPPPRALVALRADERDTVTADGSEAGESGTACEPSPARQPIPLVTPDSLSRAASSGARAYGAQRGAFLSGEGSAKAQISRALSARSREGPATPRSCVLAEKRRLHPRLRWPRLASHSSDDDGCGSRAIEAVDAIPDDDDNEKSWESRSQVASSPPSVRKAFKPRHGNLQPRPAILPRAPTRHPVLPGTVSTLHTSPSLLHHGGRPSTADSEASSTEEASCGMESSRSQESERAIAMQGVDRKWFMRVAPISCLPSEPLGTAARRAATANGGVAETNGPANDGEAGEYLHFERWGLNDDYLNALLSAASCTGGRHGLFGVKHINLSGNQLTERGVDKLSQHGSLEGLRSLSLASNRLDERGAPVLQQLLANCRRLRELDLSGNALGDAATEALCGLLQRQCPELEGLGLARCQLGRSPRGGSALGGLLGVARSLRSLDLHWNALHGEGAQALLRGLYENGVEAGGGLRRLDLAWNRLGSGLHVDPARRRDARESAKLLADVFRDGNVLFHLDISYNSFCGDDCAALASGLRTNHTLFGLHLLGNEATVDDLGFVIPLRRKLQQSSAISPAHIAPEDDAQSVPVASTEAGTAGVSAIMGEQLQREMNRYLNAVPARLRLDHPADFAAASCSLGAEGVPSLPGGIDFPSDASKVLRQNPSLHSIAGLEGVASFSERDLQNERTWAREHSRVQTISGLASSDSEAVQRNHKCCWICEHWVEHHVEYVPEPPDAEGVESVQALYGIDGFARPTCLARTEEAPRRRTRPGSEVRGSRLSRRSRGELRRSTHGKQAKTVRWVGIRMLPPTLEPIQVVFVVNGSIATAGNLALKRLHVPKTITLQAVGGSGESRIEEVSEVNIICTGADARRRIAMGEITAVCVLEDLGNHGAFTVVPRKMTDMRVFQSRSEPQEEWSFEVSVFKDFVRDCHDQVAKCFEADWRSSRLSQIIKTEAAWIDVYAYLKQVYARVILTFWHEAFVGLESVGEVAGISLDDFRCLLLGLGGEGRGRLVDHSHCKPGDLDCVFAVSHMVDRRRKAELAALPPKALARFQFLEAIIRTAFRRFLRRGGPQSGYTAAEYKHAVESLFEVTRMGEQLEDMRQSLHELLFQEEICLVYSDNLDTLRALFKTYSSSPHCQGANHLSEPAVSYIAWTALMRDAGVCDAQLQPRDVSAAFVLGKELRADETSGTMHPELSWPEFLVALGAAVRLREDYDADVFEDLLEEFFVASLEERRHHVHSRMRRNPKAASEFKPLIRFIERQFQDLDTDRNGKVSLSSLRQLFSQPEVKAALCRLRLTRSEAGVLLGTVEGECAKHGTGNQVTFESLHAALIRLKESLRGIERAIVFIEKAFEEADADGFGSLDTQEFRALMQAPALARRLSSVGLCIEDFGALFELLDEDGVGKVTMNDIIRGLVRVRDPSHGAARGVRLLEQYFNAADASDSGGLTKEQVLDMFGSEEVREQLEQAKLKNPDWEVLFEELDVDSSGDLSWEEISDGMYTFWQNNK